MWKLYEHTSEIQCQLVTANGYEHTTSCSNESYYTIEDREVQPWGYICKGSDGSLLAHYEIDKLNEAIRMCVKKNQEDYGKPV
jgi:hypothetical protein